MRSPLPNLIPSLVPALIASLTTALFLSACGSGESAILLTIDSTKPLTTVDHLHIVVTNNGQSSTPVDLPLTGRPVSIPPTHTVQLRFADPRTGPVTLQIEARDATNHILATGKTESQIIPGKETPATVVLGSSTQMPDMGTPDGATPDINFPTLQFAPAVTYGAGMGPGFILSGDFDGNGHVDLVVTNFLSNSVSVLLGNGDGTFKKSIDQKAGSSPGTSVLGDWNMDGKLDLAVVNSSPGLSVLVGNGDGTLMAPADITVGRSYWIETSDMNGDGKPDLVVSNQYLSILTLLGKGDATFELPIKRMFADVTSLALADLDGDGITDVTAVFQGKMSKGVQVLLGDGKGGVSFSQTFFYTTDAVSALLINDFNGDHQQDLALTIVNNTDVQVRLGNGNGTLRSPTMFPCGTQLAVMAAGDLNGDGFAEIVSGDLKQSVVVLPSNGDGTFRQPMTFRTGAGPIGVVLADFNGDGRLDIATTDSLDNNIAVLINRTP